MDDDKRIHIEEDEEPSEGAPEWLVTYSDLVTLLLTFFVMLFSIAIIDKQKFMQVAISLRRSFITSGSGDLFGPNSGRDLLAIIQEELNAKENHTLKKDSQQKEADEVENFVENIKKTIDDLKLSKYIEVLENKNLVILRVNSIILFDSGSADIKDSGKASLTRIAPLLKRFDREIFIQGHTDNMPINTQLYPTNWELSTKRATNIVIYLVTECHLDPTKLTPTGNSEFRPIAPNDTETNRAKNRRIDIVILK
jgi:chemotaxis protein MotB